ncbi:hypothetical protein B9Z19DRAFT_1119810 [Tuber borchii]|uniref:HIT-type domain-containing protein n=1 Tax=Tuber borchii TaxID=42251 RepID=A0A2T7A5M1_TUBBO|nr:hypothetical protein B9Z19DRAFT_1119810 [Tuber borchii]
MSTSTPEESLGTLCPLCHSRPPKYRCPACATRTCSVACVKKHKLYAQCSGRIDATTFVKRSVLLSSPATLNRDFGFLTGVERALGTALEEEDGDGGGAEGRGRLEGFFKRSGVSVKWAPRGMKRAVENCTAVSKGRKGKHVIWTVEWIVLGSRGIGGEVERVLDRNVSEHTPISQAYFYPTPPSNSTTAYEDSGSPLQPPRKKAKKDKQDTSQTRFYLKRVGCPANSPALIKLDGNKSLSVALRGRVVEEFPTVLVWSGDGDPAGYGIESGVLIEVVEEGEGEAEAKAEAAPVQGTEAMEVKQKVSDNLHDAQEFRPDLNTDTDIPQTIEPHEELASTGQPIASKLNDENTKT